MGEAIDSHPQEYLKTFSVAARSYALAYIQNGGRHPEEHITLYNGSGDQIYKGYNRERLSPRISEAIDDTKGEVITYDGQVVIAPYFSKSDGRTRDWDEVWPSRSYPLPWCMGKDDPYGTREGVPEGVGRGYPNHGVGMCAAGARGFAEEENRDYLWILNYYYTDISVEKEY
jgi:SpoIID/LytB domain protein